jgi:hypothetical protein
LLPGTDATPSCACACRQQVVAIGTLVTWLSTQAHTIPRDDRTGRVSLGQPRQGVSARRQRPVEAHLVCFCFHLHAQLLDTCSQQLVFELGLGVMLGDGLCSCLQQAVAAGEPGDFLTQVFHHLLRGTRGERLLALRGNTLILRHVARQLPLFFAASAVQTPDLQASCTRRTHCSTHNPPLGTYALLAMMRAHLLFFLSSSSPSSFPFSHELADPARMSNPCCAWRGLLAR